MNSIIIRIIFVAFALFGCSRSGDIHIPPLSESLTVIPGTGIVGFVEVGMRFSEIPDAAKAGAVVRKGRRPHKINHYHSENLGLEFISIKREPVGLLTFHTVERLPMPIPSALREVVVPFSCKPFKGTISDGISFANDPVHKDTIIQLFGPVEQTVLYSYGYVTNKYIPFIVKRPEEVEIINYSNRGIEFWMKSNTVESFRIFRPLVPDPADSEENAETESEGESESRIRVKAESEQNQGQT